MDEPIKITILGSRGSMPVSGKKHLRYGGATCCILIQHASQAIILDAGTGLMDLSQYLRGEDSLSLILTHPHLDHIIGLPLFSEVFRKDFRIDIYGASRNGLDVQSQIETLMAPPLWPVGPLQLPAKISFYPLKQRFTLRDVIIESEEHAHPGGVSVIRLTIDGKRIVFMTDCTITDENRDQLTSFCQGCDLLFCDGQYSDEEWLARSGFGHNSWNMAARFARDCGAKLTRILHHDPTHSDDILDTAHRQVTGICPNCDIACDGEEIVL